MRRSTQKSGWRIIEVRLKIGTYPNYMEQFRKGAHDSRIVGRRGIPRAVVFIDLGLDRFNGNVDTVNDGYYIEILWLFCFWIFPDIIKRRKAAGIL
jgi:hypothetical protein